MKKLTPKQSRFIDEYMIDLNATQACVRASYSGKTAMEQGSRLLRNVKISKEIEKRQAKLREKTEVTVEYVVTSLKTVAERCMGEKLDSSGANRSLELLGKHVGAFEKDNSQKKGEVNLYIQKIEQEADELVEKVQKRLKIRHDEKNAIVPQGGDKK